MNYRDLFATDVISSFMKPVDEPIVVLGPVLQIFRGILLALVLLPLRKVFFLEKRPRDQAGQDIRGSEEQKPFHILEGSKPVDSRKMDILLGRPLYIYLLDAF